MVRLCLTKSRARLIRHEWVVLRETNRLTTKEPVEAGETGLSEQKAVVVVTNFSENENEVSVVVNTTTTTTERMDGRRRQITSRSSPVVHRRTGGTLPLSSYCFQKAESNTTRQHIIYIRPSHHHQHLSINTQRRASSSAAVGFSATPPAFHASSAARLTAPAIDRRQAARIADRVVRASLSAFPSDNFHHNSHCI